MKEEKKAGNFSNMYADNVSVASSDFSEQKIIKQADADRCVSTKFTKCLSVSLK